MPPEDTSQTRRFAWATSQGCAPEPAEEHEPGLRRKEAESVRGHDHVIVFFKKKNNTFLPYERDRSYIRTRQTAQGTIQTGNSYEAHTTQPTTRNGTRRA
ncbi:hypothetical protein RSOLAG1IB_12655 [Rhizoctonia solani AG-1 IB]|uniref:Uncharacterized protein n=1 Tax=Thanatephorus cucumeris (strain AG1-IB / isolate 7/3/14) TaxID=1108050 RepID=A0A0B7G2R1_THACB|nr:hypothetical protein RSOLAG1IB_12655 [Rhizoctonia solani AG-1 IB]